MKDLLLYLDDYLFYLKGECGLTENTTRAYRYDLLFLQRLFPPNRTIKELSRLDMRLAIGKLASPPLNYSEIARTRKINALRRFFQYLYETEFIKENITEILHSPRLPIIKKEYPSVNRLLEVISYYERVYNPKIARLKRKLAIVRHNPQLQFRTSFLTRKISQWELARDKGTLFLRLLYVLMCRIGELIKIRVRDIDHETKHVLLHGKGRKDRSVRIDDQTLSLLRHIIEIEQLEPDYFIVRSRVTKKDRKGKPFQHAVALQSRVQRLRKKMGLPDHFTPHTFRGAALTHLSSLGVPIEDLQEMAGHNSILTTRRYIQKTQQQVDAGYARHPLMQNKTAPLTCPKCKVELRTGALFCDKCGSKIST